MLLFSLEISLPSFHINNATPEPPTKSPEEALHIKTEKT